MQTHILGYPRIGSQRELKKACEQYWSGKISLDELLETGRTLTLHNWKLQQETGIDLIPCNDFSYYDQVLDMTLAVGAIPPRYQEIASRKTETDLYFAMARGFQQEGLDITAMEMTKWFDTNYHYIVPEFYKNQEFTLFSDRIIQEFIRAKEAGINAKPVIIGLVTYLLLGKEKEEGFDKLDLAQNLLPVYIRILKELEQKGAEYIQFDEPFLAMDLTEKAKETYQFIYAELRKQFPDLKLIIATYFEGVKDNLTLATSLPADVLHIDLVRCPEQLNDVLRVLPKTLSLSLGIVDGRNIWKNNFQKSLQIIERAIRKIGAERIFLATSCSLLHTPIDLDLEKNEHVLYPEIKQWMAFAKQKLSEVVTLKKLASGNANYDALLEYAYNQKAVEDRTVSSLIHNDDVKARAEVITKEETRREHPFSIRKEIQHHVLQLPLFPTTTIGSFPQTKEVRNWRAKFKKGELNAKQYDKLLKQETKRTIRWQEDIGIDVLVHGEFERNDMVEYFGEQLAGFAFTQNGWVQSYGSRCVKPPVIYGDVHRPNPMTVYWSEYAQSLTKKWVKGMLTGPVTILQWSFVRDDQPRSLTCRQIALAIRDEVCDLEKAGIRIIQIDEPAIREGLPLRQSDWQDYLKWAVEAFRISASGVEDATQIHTHMCYSEFNDIIHNIADMDADVITIECSRSQMELLNAFADFKYPNEIGPGVYDIHSPRVPSKEEMVELLKKAQAVIPAEQLWVNPDCGLKTRHWEETEKALIAMVEASKEMSGQFKKEKIEY
ncbi:MULTISPECIES: 5-methyltetrahydropteroyltriglutamate--homocysteine S-methyltransferase [Chryseobacterium]|uniref:5-methyltetrahydropteroyltriglutamate--homocysteine methyltransferase n=1 Tax=Chryseobacterium camelliae TaxID=1265445 RepID=A0ABU0TH94_9FLAO|nr:MULTISPECIES: 5-methyltetrahydropteroyltriglutamate--homocysteine S-methyltransferase [Chryseobacterium]MDT3405776.1 5-methyltetrahydropteroyltriglutamate--homocysteine methyltransferase [Pseudacidovorax intermedius]MDQ1096416.1 5-methyltetrahydropteroyltriglutamate--homocysteine methyltransferase [Chryseobacterium camelliae]MDQ1100357.1 5-methyltetrahydropteroyltriglutamate--homocysteine methyltransferase [Chryseobacterium sp. SORGH_AS_1048]MDR6087698.1 5-methyltetrahydropteroyltriglutamate